MSKRKSLLKNIANGLLCSFLSRNNDVYGYWGIGKLYSLMLIKNTQVLTIDLLNKTIDPKDKEFGFLIHQYQEKLMISLIKKNIELAIIKKAEIILSTKSIKIM